MIPNIRFIWKQLNGPQITAVTKAILKWFRNQFDRLIEYFWNFSVATANSDHLTLFGTLVGFQRPIVVPIDEDYFYFSDIPPVEGSAKGLSWKPGIPDFESEDPHDWGGQFSEVSPGANAIGEIADTDWYRALLQGFLNSDGYDGSLRLLEQIVITLSRYDNPERAPYYLIEFLTESVGAKAVGDINLDMDNIIPWRDPYTSYELMQSLANGMYAPVPRVYPILQGVDPLAPQQDKSRKMLQFLNIEGLWVGQVLGDAGYALTEDDFPQGMEEALWNTQPDGKGEAVTVGFQLYSNTIIFAYQVNPLEVNHE